MDRTIDLRTLIRRPSAGMILAVCVLAATSTLQVVTGDVTIEPTNPGPQSAGSNINIQCTCTSPCTDLEWYHHGRPQSQRPGVVISPAVLPGKFISVLSLEDIDETFGGQWKCADRDDQRDYASVDLVIESADDTELEIYEPSTPSVHVPEGGDITLYCRGPPRVDLQWVHNNVPLVDNAHRVTITAAFDVETGFQKSLLSRRNSDSMDGGQYVCRDAQDTSRKVQITVNIGQPSSESHPVSIIEPSGSSQLRLSPGRTFSLKCVGDQDTVLVWYHEGEMLSEESEEYRIEVGEDDGKTTSLLTKDGATEEYSGQYSCQNADNQHDKASVDVAVSDEAWPPGDRDGAPTNEPTVLILKVGGTKHHLDCSVSGSGDNTVRWAKYEQVIESDDKYSISATSTLSTLEIRNPGKEDRGLYECTFINSSGETVAVMSFNVITVDCPSLKPPDDGSFAQCPKEPVYGETCSFQCRSGLKLTHTKALVCGLSGNTGVWDHDVPECSTTLPGGFQGAVPTSISHVILRVGGNQNLQCSESSAWNKGHAELSDGQKYVIRDNYLLITKTDKFDEGVYNCYVILRDKKGNVVDRGIKKFNVTTLPCPKLNELAHGRIFGCSSRAVYGETCFFKCDSKYELVGSRSTTCELGYRHTQVYWTGDIPVCKRPGHNGYSPHGGSSTRPQPPRNIIFVISLFSLSIGLSCGR